MLHFLLAHGVPFWSERSYEEDSHCFAGDGANEGTSLIFLTGQNLHTSQVAHEVVTYLGFWSIERLGIFLLPQDKTLIDRKATPAPNIKFVDTHLYNWERELLWGYKHKTMSPLELERGALDPELSHRPSHLLLKLSSKIWLSNFLEGAWLLGNLTYPDEWDWRQGNATVFVMRGQDYEC